MSLNCEDCVSWLASVHEMDKYRMEALRQAERAKTAATDARVLLADTVEGKERARLEKELNEMRRRAANAEDEVRRLTLEKTALPAPEVLYVNGIDILEGVQIMLDSLVSSMDAGSGFLDWREWCAIRQVGRAIGVADLDKLTEGAPDNSPWPDPALPLTDGPRSEF